MGDDRGSGSGVIAVGPVRAFSRNVVSGKDRPIWEAMIEVLETIAISLTSQFVRERVTRIELAFSAWEADVLPLNYTRMEPQP